MQAKKRYLLVLLSCAFLAYCYFGGYRLKSNHKVNPPEDSMPTFFDPWSDQLFTRDLEPSPHIRRTGGNNYNHKKVSNSIINQKCRMETCFDYSKCHNDFKVYVYPTSDDLHGGEVPLTPSPAYQKVLDVILESRYYTSDPSQACLFVLAIDTLDRDSLSVDYVRNVPSRLQRLKLWNGGKNHVVFNLYSGTWPDYAEDDLGFDTGEAILAKASMSVTSLRPGFDISIPLFHKSLTSSMAVELCRATTLLESLPPYPKRIFSI
ncbi:Exostosin-1 [Homalodisca vitripennis]|nr:Exostosin-1 [Homalodisca vitripennis]